MIYKVLDSPKGPRPKNSPPDCFLNGLSVGTTAGASFTNSIVIETLVIDYELNSETKRKSRSFDLLFFLAPQVGLAAAGGRALKTTIQVVFATDSLMLSLAILLPGCSRPTVNKVKKIRYAFAYLIFFYWLPKLDSNQRHRD